MELELDRTQLNGYETVLDTTVCHEETLEMIVPDACPDILRICDTEGKVCLRGKEAQEGRVELSGTVKTAILYLPDGEEGMRRMEVNLPFTCTADSANIHPGCSVVAVPRVQSAETRSLNPRKVLVRVNLAVCVRVYAAITDELCSGVANPEEAGVEQMVERQEAYVVACVQEKPFTFADDMAIPGSKPEAEELLKSRVALHCGEAKIIGNKLIFKGEAQLQALYRAAEGALCTAEFELPFSQIMEVTGAGEDAGCEVRVVLSSAECSMDSGDGRTISVSLGLLAQAVVRESCSLQMLTDVYSTAYDLAPDTQGYSLNRLLDQGVKSQTVREILETGMLAKEVADAYVTIGSLSQNRDGERLSITAEAGVTVVYLTEDDVRTSVRRTLPVSCPLELPEGAVCSCLCTCPGQVYATPTTGGLEVRFSLDFQFLALSQRKVVGVSAIRMEQDTPRDTSNQPSIVLRTVSHGERLWDIAKSYGTTARDILQANALEEEALPAGQLLLIPRKR